MSKPAHKSGTAGQINIWAEMQPLKTSLESFKEVRATTPPVDWESRYKRLVAALEMMYEDMFEYGDIGMLLELKKIIKENT